jgi:hypothetical protein
MHNHTANNKSTALSLLHPTGSVTHAGTVIDSQRIERVAIFTVCLTNNRIETVSGATAYQPEGPLTTFFAANSSRGVIDSWATRVASFRTADLVSVRREVISADVASTDELVAEPSARQLAGQAA